MDIDNFIVHVKSDEIYKDNAEDVETRFDTSNFEIKQKSNKSNEKWIRWKKHERIYWIKRKNMQLFKRQQWWR